MSAPSHCRICSGALEFALVGGGEAVTAAQLSPTNHVPGAHGDLFRCTECGTVEQPSLPGGSTLQELYGEMRDEGYLDEEAGRRATAERLLDLIGERTSAGRLLDVGCGYGLLLDEARRRGYGVTGLELSESAARYAADALGLDIRRAALEDLAADEEPFDVVLLVDVLEHLKDPRAAIDRCRDLLAPGGTLCVATPDPSSLTARLAGRRWWGYIPAHSFLLPRRTLRELLSASGLVISTDVPFVRTFSARRWLGGMAERSGRLAALAEGVARRVGGRSLSLSLGDERVMLAHRTEVVAPAEPLVRDRGGATSVQVVLPAYRAASTIAAVAGEMPIASADRALLVDDASPDDTCETALRHGLEVIRHPTNRGYGANQKTCYVRTLLDGADVIVMVHADNQYDPSLVTAMVTPIEAGEADVVIGSRLLEDRAIAGGMPRWKWLGNRFLTAIENRAFRRSFSEYHTGYRAFSADFLRSVAFLRNSDEFVFDQEIFAQAVARGARVVELAIPTRYFLEASSVSFRASVEYGLRTLYVLARFRLDRRLPWALLRRPAAAPGRSRVSAHAA